VYALVDDPRVEGWRLGALAFVHWMAGRLEEAYNDAIACARLGEDGAETGADFAGHVALALGDPTRARLALDLHRARELHGRLLSTAEVLLQAGISALEGDRAAAATDYRSAIAFYRSRDLRLLLGLALCEYAVLGRPDRPELDAVAEEARAILTALGSPPLLRWLETGLADQGTVDRAEGDAVRGDGAEGVVESAAS